MEIFKKNAVYIISLVVAAAVFVVSGIMLVDTLMPPAQNLDRFKDEGATSISPAVSEKNPEIYVNPIDFKSLKAANPDIYGWITVDGTKVDYPILRSGPDKEEDFYLTHDYTGEEKRYGSIFMQRLNAEDFTDSNTVLYGHNMLSGAMFGTLKKFKSQEFFDQNRNIYIYTPENIYRYEICAAYVSDNKNIMRSYNFHMLTGYQRFITLCLTSQNNKSALIREELPVFVEDKIITLSTCTSNDTERYIVVGKLVETLRTE
ncbi:MAG: class B sortase [Clostridia bacterium]|nr:class B sortase [Clostridia bacterium]